MPAQRTASGIGWIGGLLLARLLAVGWASPGLALSEHPQPPTSETASSMASNTTAGGVREIRVGIGGGTMMREAQAGKMPDGYLVTVTWTDSAELVRILCLHPQAAGCQRSEVVPAAPGHPGYRRQFIVLFGKDRMSDLTLKILTHEICHAVASSQNLQPDPCHGPDT